MNNKDINKDKIIKDTNWRMLLILHISAIIALLNTTNIFLAFIELLIIIIGWILFFKLRTELEIINSKEEN